MATLPRCFRTRIAVASGSFDGTVKLWEASSGVSLRTLRAERRYERLEITSVTGITDAQRTVLFRCYRDPVCVGDPFALRQGSARVPSGPGLGIEIDEAALRAYAV